MKKTYLLTILTMIVGAIFITPKANAFFAQPTFPRLLQCYYTHTDMDEAGNPKYDEHGNKIQLMYSMKVIYASQCPHPEEPFEGHITDNYSQTDSQGLAFAGHTRDEEECIIRLDVTVGAIN